MQKSLIIEDNGRGIPEEEIGRIFDKGFTGATGEKKTATPPEWDCICVAALSKTGAWDFLRIGKRKIYPNNSYISRF